MTVTTPEDLAVMQDRIAVNMRKIRPHPPGWLDEDDSPDLGPESDLQKKIVADATANGWPVLSFRMSKRAYSYLTPGWPDILIAMPKARTVFIETKSATGVLREKQRLLCNMFRMLGHEYYKCKSFKRYLEIKESK